MKFNRWNTMKAVINTRPYCWFNFIKIGRHIEPCNEFIHFFYFLTQIFDPIIRFFVNKQYATIPVQLVHKHNVMRCCSWKMDVGKFGFGARIFVFFFILYHQILRVSFIDFKYKQVNKLTIRYWEVSLLSEVALVLVIVLA